MPLGKGAGLTHVCACMCGQTFWHSSAHVLGEALEACFGVRLTIGPAVEEGFYYDCYMGARTLTDAEKPVLEKKIEQVPLPACTLTPCRSPSWGPAVHAGLLGGP